MRLIRPMNVARICALLLGVGMALPATLQAAPETQNKPAATSKTTARKTTYSASSSALAGPGSRGHVPPPGLANPCGCAPSRPR